MTRVPKDFDFSPRRIEANEELEAVVWAENHGWIVRKMQYIGRRGCPDRFFFGYGKIIMIEFKKAKGRLSEGQSEEHKRLEAAGTPVKTFYSQKDAIDFLRSQM